LIHDGAKADTISLSQRHGVLFDPDRFPFLEGRSPYSVRQIHQRIDAPLVPDGTIYRALEKLIVLDGERISYRALDVEQIGSVYETMMGFTLETATGLSVAIRAQKRQGAPTAVDLEALLREPGNRRDRWLQDHCDRKLTDRVEMAVAAAESVEDLHAVLLPVIDLAATPDLVPKGAMVLQPSEERRRSGSHYTPRSLTQPIVRTALEPVLARLRGADGSPPLPEQILDLKVCDPAMGSGAFLVEASRYLGKEMVDSWHYHREVPAIPLDEDEEVFARRLIAQRCLYGVDRNPMAVDLAKVSLWLATLAKDHALRHGDSLVGLSRKQIEAFHWQGDAPEFKAGFEVMRVAEHMTKVGELRQLIREADESVADWELRGLWNDAQAELSKVRLFGDLVLAAFFQGERPNARDAKRIEYASSVVDGKAEQYQDWLEEWRHSEPPLAPFHWEIEVPEVFDRENSGFDAIVGNPPFAGKNSVAASNVARYPDWLKELHQGSHGNSDQVAHFFRRAFNLIRKDGAFGLIATNTIGQGDNRATGLRWICHHGGEIFAVRKHVRWPGLAAVVVSVLHVMKDKFLGQKPLDGRGVETITAFLFHRGGHDDPAVLGANSGKSFQGTVILGAGFIFDDADNTGLASSITDMHSLCEKTPENSERIFPLIGYAEISNRPRLQLHRYVINFANMSENEARRWPDLMTLVENKVRPERMKLLDNADGRRRKQFWWQFGRYTPALYTAVKGLDRVLVTASQAASHFAFAFAPTGLVYTSNLNVFPLSSNASFGCLQSQIHETWARFFMSTLGDALAYTPTTCFETFPFPENWETQSDIEAAGKDYYDFRAEIMVRNEEGLTKTYNRFHDPDEDDTEILKLRELHAEMDRAVLDAYGWSDIPTDCEFFLDYEIDEEEWGNRKNPWRYRWPDEVRDEVLARLLELNAQRAREEARTGAAASGGGRNSRRSTRASASGGLL
jgi:hypothetical protein